MSDAQHSPTGRDDDGAELDDKPPLLGSWRNIYLVVLGTLVVVVTAFAVITQVYS